MSTKRELGELPDEEYAFQMGYEQDYPDGFAEGLVEYELERALSDFLSHNGRENTEERLTKWLQSH